MIKINLLSPWDKENLKWEKMNNLVLQGIFWIILAEAFFIAFFFFSAEYLKAEEEAVGLQLADIQKQQSTKDVQQMESKLKDYKGKINNIYSIQTSQLNWTLLLEGVANTVPEGVELKNISVSDGSTADKPAAAGSVKKYKINISGKAQTRENLLDLEKALAKSEIFTGLEYDDSNYMDSSNIDFSYVFYIARDKLLK